MPDVPRMSTDLIKANGRKSFARLSNPFSSHLADWPSAKSVRTPSLVTCQITAREKKWSGVDFVYIEGVQDHLTRVQLSSV